MNKSQIIKNLAKKTQHSTEDDVERSIHQIINFISETLSKADRVEIRNFGTFSIRPRQRRFSRNPKTGTSILVEAKNHPYFRPSKNLKASINR